MNILCDRHHADLWWSLELLAKRLGAKLYCPYGMEWYDQGYFRLYGDLRKQDPYRWLAKQYLVDTIYDSYFRESKMGCVDYPKPNLITLDEFKDTPFDIIICSVHENEPYFAKLKEFQPHAKFMRQVGNDLDTNIDQSLYSNLLASANSPYEAFSGHKVLYRQEFDLNLFRYQPISQFRNLYTFQNGMEDNEDAWGRWTDLKHELSEFTFKSYGGGNEDGKFYSKRRFIEAMLESSFIFQTKGQWEGYGHVVHNAMCLGRPMILKRSDYAGKLAEPLLIKDETYLEITDPELIFKIRHYSQPVQLRTMSDKARRLFNEVVDFDQEFIAIRKFFEELV